MEAGNWPIARRGVRLGAACVLAWLPLTACAQVAPAPARDGPAAVPSSKGAGFESADQLLRALETADRGLRTLTADVRYEREFGLQGDTQVRRGKLWFDSGRGAGGEDEAKPGASRRKFAIRFDTLYVGDVVRPEEQTFIFDGEWLIERSAEQKKVARWQVAPPGKDFDPLRVGSGPLPIPIGQKRDDIVKRYEATLVPAREGLGERVGEFGSLIEGAWQVRLTPKAGGGEEEFKEIRLWYARGRAGEGVAEGRLLPLMARTLNGAGDVSLVVLINVETQDVGAARNERAAVPAEVMDARVPEGWAEDVHPWREREAGGEMKEGADAGEP